MEQDIEKRLKRLQATADAVLFLTWIVVFWISVLAAWETTPWSTTIGRAFALLVVTGGLYVRIARESR